MGSYTNAHGVEAHLCWSVRRAPCHLVSPCLGRQKALAIRQPGTNDSIPLTTRVSSEGKGAKSLDWEVLAISFSWLLEGFGPFHDGESWACLRSLPNHLWCFPWEERWGRLELSFSWSLCVLYQGWIASSCRAGELSGSCIMSCQEETPVAATHMADGVEAEPCRAQSLCHSTVIWQNQNCAAISMIDPESVTWKYRGNSSLSFMVVFPGILIILFWSI